MMTVTLLFLLAAVDPRLATLTQVAVQPVDDLKDDRPVAACLADHLPDALPLAVVPPGDAPATLRVQAELTGGTSRRLQAAIGGEDSVSLGTATLQLVIDGRVVWRGFGNADAGSRLVKRSVAEERCALADAGIDALRKAMKKARGK